MPKTDIATAIATAATAGTFPDARPGRFLDAAAVTRLARENDLTPKAVERAALVQGVCPLRYARNLHAMRLEEQIRLLDATVALVGLGGLGGGLVECLVRAGVGTIRGADGDRFEETNLNRQLLADMAAVGAPKAERALARAAAVNPSVTFTARDAFLDEAGMDALLAGADLAVDALGGLADREALIRAARRRKLPLVTGAVAGYTAIVATVLPGRTSPLALLAGDGTGPAAEDVLGCPAPAVMAVAALEASEALRLLVGRPPALADKALIIDLETMRFDTVVF